MATTAPAAQSLIETRYWGGFKGKKANEHPGAAASSPKSFGQEIELDANKPFLSCVFDRGGVTDWSIGASLLQPASAKCRDNCPTDD